jgi:hypothetical protein
MTVGRDGEPVEGLVQPSDLIGSRFVLDFHFFTAYDVNQQRVG